MICTAVNYIFTKSLFNHLIPTLQVSAIWTKQFLDCNPQFYKKEQKPLVVEHKNTHNKKDF